MTRARYEAHLTFPAEAHGHVEAVATQTGWVFSKIAGCPLLGAGTYCYLTNYDTNPAALLLAMQRVQRMVGDRDGEALALRGKIERIVYDTRTGVDEIGDGIKWLSDVEARGQQRLFER
jgi:hypothetical protein